MNIVSILKGTIRTVWEILIFFVVMVLSIFGAIFIFPFCRRENTVDAVGKWFAWHPVFVGNPYNMSVKNFRWLVFVNRWYNLDGPVYMDVVYEYSD